MGYAVEGNLYEVCTCNVICPCWVGAAPDLGYCEGILGWKIKAGNIEGVDVSGQNFAMLVHIPGVITDGNWEARIYLDNSVSDEQQEAILNLWGGKLGGPVTDMAALVKDIKSVEKTNISFDAEGVNGTIKIGDGIGATIEEYKGSTGATTALHDTIFSSVLGSPTYIGKASSFKAKVPGFDIDLKDHNAVCLNFKFQA